MGEDMTLQMAKASRDDLDRFGRFTRQVEMVKNGYWEDFEAEEIEENGDQELLLLKRNTWSGIVDKSKWLDAWMPFLTSGALFRILGGYETMFSNMCDPDSDVIAFRPDIEKILIEGGFGQE